MGSGRETEKNKCDLNKKNKCNCECKNIYKTYLKKRKDIQLQSCEPQQSDQSNCTLSCSNGFTGNNVTYLCNVTTNDNCVLIGSQEILCEKGLFVPNIMLLVAIHHNRSALIMNHDSCSE